MIRKHSAKVLTLRNVLSGDKEITKHFVLIGGLWYYNGSTDTECLSISDKGFWKFSIAEILKDGFPISLERIKNAFYHGPNKSMQIAMREWTTNQPVYGVPF